MIVLRSLMLGVLLNFTSQLIQPNIVEYLYQSIPAHWLQSCSIDPLLKYLEGNDFNTVLSIVTCDGIYHISIVILQQ